MTVSEKIKAMDNKIKQNKAQYNLEKQTAFSLRSVCNYEFLTREDILLENNCYKKLLKSKYLNIHHCSRYHYCTGSANRLEIRINAFRQSTIPQK